MVLVVKRVCSKSGLCSEVRMCGESLEGVQ